jgi:hypothetical protein
MTDIAFRPAGLKQEARSIPTESDLDLLVFGGNANTTTELKKGSPKNEKIEI